MNGEKVTEVESRARELLRESLGVPADALDKSATLDSLSAWTSLKHIAVVEEVERAVGRRLEVDEILSMAKKTTDVLRKALK